MRLFHPLVLACLGFIAGTLHKLAMADDDPVVVGPKATRRFELHRTHDDTGQRRRTGIVADGVVFGDGHVAMRWRHAFTEPAIETLLYADIDAVVLEHCDGGASIHWLDAESQGGDER